MGISIKNDEAERLARELARETGESLTTAIRRALEERLARVEDRRTPAEKLALARSVLRRVDALPVIGRRPADEVLRYDMTSPERRGPAASPDAGAARWAGADIVVDTSAVLAALFAAPQRDAILVALAEAQTVLISSCCLLEASIVASARLGEEGIAELQLLLDAFAVETVSFTPDEAVLAGDAWQRFGEGRHPAALNILDCCSYALARVTGRRLLATGDDFTKTDAKLADLTPAPAT